MSFGIVREPSAAKFAKNCGSKTLLALGKTRFHTESEKAERLYGSEEYIQNYDVKEVSMNKHGLGTAESGGEKIECVYGVKPPSSNQAR